MGGFKCKIDYLESLAVTRFSKKLIAPTYLGEPVRDWPLLGEDIITKLVVMRMRAKAVMDNLLAFVANGNPLGERRFRDDRK